MLKKMKKGEMYLKDCRIITACPENYLLHDIKGHPKIVYAHLILNQVDICFETEI